ILVPSQGAPVGNFTVQFVTTFTTNIQQRFIHTFANVVILPGHLYTNAFVQTQTTTVGTPIGSPVGTLVTNVVTNTTLVPGITNGDFYILPTTDCGDFFNITTQLINIIATTNTLPINTNGVTNAVAPVASIVTFFTNYTLSVFEVPC